MTLFMTLSSSSIDTEVSTLSSIPRNLWGSYYIVPSKKVENIFLGTDILSGVRAKVTATKM